MIKRDARGFTLLEVTVALIILGLGFAGLFGRLGDSTGAASLADRQRLATATAQSLLAELGRSRPLIDGESNGDIAEGMKWHLVVMPFQQPAADQPASPLAGHVVMLTVSWVREGRTESIRFDTLLLSTGA